jgi:AcrR family transcriptional regulator
VQDRALRTRNTILLAAAKVFEEYGVKAATIAQILAEANVTKGALYFHFPSKEDLVEGVIGAQDALPAIPDRACKVQEVVDLVMLQAYRLRVDCIVRAGARLTLDQRTDESKRVGPFLRWTGVCEERLNAAQRQGELLPHAVPAETAALLVGSFAGVQAMSQALCGYEDITQRALALLRHVLPSVVQSSVLTAIDLSEGRGRRVFLEVAEHADEELSLGVPVPS